MEKFTADPGKLKSHSEYLSDLAQRVSDVADRSSDVSFGADSFGLVGQAFAAQAK